MLGILVWEDNFIILNYFLPSSAQAQAQLEAELALFSFDPDKPMGRADKPMGRTDKPMGRQPGKVFFQCQDKLGNVRLG